MSAFSAEQIKTSEKMSDLVMEYASQYIAEDFLEVYEKASEKSLAIPEVFVPPDFDEKIYKKIAGAVRRNTGRSTGALRSAVRFVAMAIGVLCAAFTAAVWASETLRSEVVRVFFPFF